MAGTSEAGTSRGTVNTPGGSAYDVFVSFRGPDTRNNITDFLYVFMKEKGICVFRDTEEVRNGEAIGDELHRAVPDSRIYVVVFSKGYASSAWCLRELAMMVDCRRDPASRKVILPIFYEYEEKYWMHDLIREMGREIVNSESPGKRSRLWDPKLARDVIKQKQGTDQVLAINLLDTYEVLTGKEFKGMSNLRFLNLYHGAELSGKFRNFQTNLLWLTWKVNKLDSRPNPNFFKMDNLVILVLWGDGITDNLMEDLRMGNLRVLEIVEAVITRLPDLSRFPKLEIIQLLGCLNLEEISSSIGVLGYLKRLIIFSSESLTRLPEELGSAKALQELRLSYGSTFLELPESIGRLGDLRILDVTHSCIQKLPSSFGNLKSLEDLILHVGISSASPLPLSLRRLSLCLCGQSMQSGTSLDGRDNMGNMIYPIRLSNLGSLRRLCYLNLGSCKCVDFSGIERMELLEELEVSMCGFAGEIPDLSNLRRLKRVKFSRCDSLISVPCMVGDCRLIIENCREFVSFDGPYRLYHNKRLRRSKRRRTGS